MNGGPIGVNQQLKNAKLADTLEKIRDDPMAMYKSPLADDIIADLGSGEKHISTTLRS